MSSKPKIASETARLRLITDPIVAGAITAHDLDPANVVWAHDGYDWTLNKEQEDNLPQVRLMYDKDGAVLGFILWEGNGTRIEYNFDCTSNTLSFRPSRIPEIILNSLPGRLLSILADFPGATGMEILSAENHKVFSSGESETVLVLRVAA